MCYRPYHHHPLLGMDHLDVGNLLVLPFEAFIWTGSHHFQFETPHVVF